MKKRIRLLSMALLLLALAGRAPRKREAPAAEEPDTDAEDRGRRETGAPAPGKDTVRVTIALEGLSLRDAGYTASRISDDPAALACRDELERRQDEVVARIAEALGHPLDVVHRFTRNVNAVSANVSAEEEETIRGVEGVSGPGRVTKYLGIDGSLHDTMLGTSLCLEDDGYRPERIQPTGRIGIGYASEEDQARLWRFLVK